MHLRQSSPKIAAGHRPIAESATRSVWSGVTRPDRSPSNFAPIRRTQPLGRVAAAIGDGLARGGLQSDGVEQAFYLLASCNMGQCRARSECGLVQIVERRQTARIELAEYHPLGQAVDKAELQGL